MTTRPPIPCPFCSSVQIKSKHYDGRHWEECQTCFATGPAGTRYTDEDDGDFTWNTRAQPTPDRDGLIEKLESHKTTGELTDYGAVHNHAINEAIAIVRQHEASQCTCSDTYQCFSCLMRQDEADSIKHAFDKSDCVKQNADDLLQNMGDASTRKDEAGNRLQDTGDTSPASDQPREDSMAAWKALEEIKYILNNSIGDKESLHEIGNEVSWALAQRCEIPEDDRCECLEYGPLCKYCESFPPPVDNAYVAEGCEKFIEIDEKHIRDLMVEAAKSIPLDMQYKTSEQIDAMLRAIRPYLATREPVSGGCAALHKVPTEGCKSCFPTEQPVGVTQTPAGHMITEIIYEGIKHGDEDHKNWLMDNLQKYVEIALSKTLPVREVQQPVECGKSFDALHAGYEFPSQFARDAAFNQYSYGWHDALRSTVRESVIQALVMLHDMIDGGEECRGRDSEISDIIRLLEQGR